MTRTSRWRLSIALIAVAAYGLTACSSSSSGGDAGYGDLTIALDEDYAAKGYDPLKYSDQRIFFEGMYDSLFKIGEDGRVTTGLVTDYSYNEDQTELTLELDTDVMFDDGSTLTAEVVKQNLDSRNQPELVAYTPFADGEDNEISEVVVVDDATVALRFAEPKPGYEANLVHPAGAIVGPRGVSDRESLNAIPDGSGPLELNAEATVKGNSYELVKKDGHAAAELYPFDAYVFKPIVDPQARVNAVISGEVDLAFITAETQAQVESAGVGLVANGGTIMNLLPFDKNGTLAPQWGDARVNQALSLAIDRETFVNAVHPGEIPTANALPSDSAGYLPELEGQYAYDPETAKQLLAEAGFADGFSFDFVIDAVSQRDMEAIQPYWAAIGVDVVLKNAASTEERFAAVRNTPMGGPIDLTWDNPAGSIFGVVLGFANPHGASNADISSAMSAYGAAGNDEAARTSALQDLNRAVVDSGWLIPLYERLSPLAYNADLVSEPTFPGTSAAPLLSTIQPTS